MDGQTDDMAVISMVRLLCNSGAAQRIRENAQLSKAEMAVLAETSGAAVSRWESGTRSPHGAHALRYARALLRLQDLLSSSREKASA